MNGLAGGGAIQHFTAMAAQADAWQHIRNMCLISVNQKAAGGVVVTPLQVYQTSVQDISILWRPVAIYSTTVGNHLLNAFCRTWGALGAASPLVSLSHSQVSAVLRCRIGQVAMGALHKGQRRT